MIRSLGIGLLTALVLAVAPAMAQTRPAPLYLFVYRPGPAWEAGKPLGQQKLGKHGAYMQQLVRDGKVVAGGPWVGADGGMAIVHAASAEAANAILAADPAITAGVFEAEVRTWDPLVDSGKPLRP
jgi:uncharacterized protein YciI